MGRALNICIVMDIHNTYSLEDKRTKPEYSGLTTRGAVDLSGADFYFQKFQLISKDLVGDVNAESSLNYSDPELVDFRILVREIRAKSKIAILELKKADSGLFEDALESVM